jgi:hypothetical protein
MTLDVVRKLDRGNTEVRGSGWSSRCGATNEPV